MKIQAYTAFSGVIVITVATPRAQEIASTKFTAAHIHEDFVGRVRAVLREHKHCGETALAYPAAARLQTYFPTSGGKPLYALRELMPAGAPRDIDPEWQLEIMRIRYGFALHVLPAYFGADETIAEGFERHVEKALFDLFAAQAVPNVFIPGDQTLRPGDRSEIDISVEFGPATARTGVDIPAPV